MSIKFPVRLQWFASGSFWIVDADGEQVAGVHSVATAQQVVARLNAFDGRSDDEVQALIDFGGVSQLSLAYDAELARANELEIQRNELLAALELAVASTPKRYTDDRNEHGDRVAKHPAWVDNALSVIAKAKAGV